jgi:hypothetical protein
MEAFNKILERGLKKYDVKIGKIGMIELQQYCGIT